MKVHEELDTNPGRKYSTGQSHLSDLTQMTAKKKALKQMLQGFDKIWRRPTLPPVKAVPSAQPGLTALFGMGRGGHRRYNHHKIFVHTLVDMALPDSYRDTIKSLLVSGIEYMILILTVQERVIIRARHLYGKFTGN